MPFYLMVQPYLGLEHPFYKEIIASASQPEPEPEPSLDPSNLAYTTFTHTNGTVYTFDIVGQLPAPSFSFPGMMVVRRW